MSASELLPADLIIFNITINAEADSPQDVYKVHKERESVLAELLTEFDIKEEDIKYQPIRMNKRYRNDDRSKVTQSSQQVSVTFNDFSIYEDIQVTLIENGFDTFNGQFSSTEIEEGKRKALVKAIQTAKERAELIASTTGVKLSGVTKIHFSDHQAGIPRKSGMMRMESMSADASMMDFSQTVSVTATINISFGID
ncbi:MAG: SIMPL domain-containing protein [Balneolaceae bacterium]|nr:SIMPL domain-containing protein [Balneolaceae bacterium]